MDEAVRNKLNESEIFKNLKNYYNDQININYDEFIQRISKLRNKVEQDSSIKILEIQLIYHLFYQLLKIIMTLEKT